MNAPVACEDAPAMSASAVCLLVKPVGAAGEALREGLRAAGCRVVVVPTIYDAVAEAARLGPALGQLVVGIDHFGPADFRLFPLVRREWPHVTLVAFHSPGFAYKGRVAELVGADVVLSSLDEMEQFVAGLAGEAVPARPPVAPAAAPPRPGPAVRPDDSAIAALLEAVAEEPVPVEAPAEPAAAVLSATAPAPATAAPAAPAPVAPTTATAAPAPPAPAAAATFAPDAGAQATSAADAAARAELAARNAELGTAETARARAQPADAQAPHAQPGTRQAAAGGKDFAEQEAVSGPELTEDELRMLLGEDEQT